MFSIRQVERKEDSIYVPLQKSRLTRLADRSRRKYRLVINGRCLVASNQLRPFFSLLVEEIQESYDVLVVTTKERVLELVSKKGVEIETHLLSETEDSQVFEGVQFDPKRTVLLDQEQDSYQSNPSSGICISRWTGNSNDNILKYLSKVLLRMASLQNPDITRVLKTVIHQNLRNKLTLNQK